MSFYYLFYSSVTSPRSIWQVGNSALALAGWRHSNASSTSSLFSDGQFYFKFYIL